MVEYSKNLITNENCKVWYSLCMKILIVDNGAKYIKKLVKLLSSYDVNLISRSELRDRFDEGYDVIILSGGSEYPIINHDKEYSKEIEFILKTNKPVVGICLGFQLIVYAFGGKLEKLEGIADGILEIKVIDNDSIFQNKDMFLAKEHHKWSVTELPPVLVPLAISPTGYEAIRHAIKPIYGFQFHPESFTDVTFGDEVFYNLLRRWESVISYS